jgi:AraC-like DNA-binding protein
MDAVSVNLYVLAMASIVELRTQVLFQNSTNSQLGRITLAGVLRDSRGISRDRPMRVLGSYALVYVLDGSGSYEDANGYRQAIGPGDAILVFPTLGHYYGPGPGEHWTEIYLVFDGCVFDLWQRTGLIDPRRPVLHAEPVDHWFDRIESVLGAPRTTGFSPPLLEVCRLQQVLAELLLGGPRGGGRSADMRWAARMCALLSSDLEQALDLHELAARQGTTYHSFRKRFARIVGVPPARYRRMRIVDRACELMQSGELTDKQIAGQLGFCDESHFSRRFKETTGVAPRQFRRRLPGPSGDSRR